MQLDYEKYRPKLARLNLTSEHENDIMDTVWNMMASHVDQAFGVHPAQLSRGKAQDINLQSPDYPLRIEDENHTDTRH